MTLLAFALFAAAVGVMVLVHWRTQRRLEDRVTRRQVELHDADEARQRALYKQHKHAHQRNEEMARQTQLLADRAHATLEDARLMHARVDGFFADRRVQAWLDQGVSGREPTQEATDGQ